MRISFLASAAAVAAICVPAAASAGDLGSGLSVSGGATLVSDYRFRGISQTNVRPALQGTFTLSHSSGLYATWWGSSIDDYIANGADSENDLIVGYRHGFGSVTIDGGVLYYVYPGHGAATTNFVEPYVSLAKGFGPLTAKVTATYAPKQRALSVGNGAEDNFYLAGDLSVAVPKSPLSLTGHLGHTWGPSYLSIGDEYTDWNLGASIARGRLTLGLVYVDTSKDSYSPIGRNISGSGVVGSVGVSF
jgi:uncharacterized protein (TIGR02001 family)